MMTTWVKRILLASVVAGVGLAVTVRAAPRMRRPATISPQNLKKIEAAVPARPRVTPARPRRILVFWRCEGFFHAGGIAGANKAIELMGKKTGAFTADFSTDYAVFDPANLARYDAIVLNNTTRLKFPDETKKRALLNFVRGGKGLVGIHSATDNFYDWPEAARMLGGLFNGHPWHAGGTWAFKLEEPSHPLLRAFGGKNFKLKDEIYQFKDPYTRADRRVLITLDLSDPHTNNVKGKRRADNDYAAAWIKYEGKGRVFYCVFGHNMSVFWQPAIVQFYLDGIQWAIGDLKADASPR